MAPSRAVRSTSRRDTPVSPAKSAGPVASSNQLTGRRSTRSQSREFSATSDDQSSLTDRTVRQIKDERTPEPALDTIAESAEVDYPELNPGDAPDAVFELNSDGLDLSSSAHSGITSYSQYELSKIDQESMVIALPFLYQYSDSLLSLFSSRDAAELERLHRDLQQPASRSSKKLSSLFEGFTLNRKHYGDDHAIDLNVALRTIAGLGQADEIPDGAWRPDAVLYMANLAQYLSSIYSSSEENETAKETLTSLFNSFPALFGPVFGAEARHQEYYSSDLLINDALLLVLEIRTQYLLQGLSQMEAHLPFGPEEMLQAIFYIHHDRLRGPDYMDELSTLPSNFETIFTKRISEIRQHFLGDISNSVDLDGLRMAFPFTGFLVRLAQWAELMAKQHKDVITAQGGIIRIQSELQDELERRHSGKEDTLAAKTLSISGERHSKARWNSEKTGTAEAPNAAGSTDPVGPPVPNSPNEVQTVKPLSRKPRPRKSLEWRAKEQQTLKKMLVAIKARKAANATEKAQASARSEKSDPAFDINQGDDAGPILPSPARIQDLPPPSQQVFAVLETMRKHKAQGSEENIDNSGQRKRAFIDRQPGARRITFDSQDEMSADHEKSSAKRKAPETDDDYEDDDYEGDDNEDDDNEDDDSEDDDSEDDDFEVDPRSARPILRRQAEAQLQGQGGRQARSKTTTTQGLSLGSPSKRARIENARRNMIDDEEDDEEEEEGGEKDDNIAARRHQPRSASSEHPNSRLPLHERQNAPPSAPVRESSTVLPVGMQVTAINQQAPPKTANRPAKSKQPQQRSKWTEEEADRLENLIKENGVSWSSLLRLDLGFDNGGKLQQRDQVSLRDKARNMKMEYLKTGSDLPKNFENIVLGNRLKGILQAQGIVYNDR